MQQIIRFNTFETNSSTTHSCVVCTEEEFEKWKKGELVASYGEHTLRDKNDFDGFEKYKEEYEGDTYEDYLLYEGYYDYHAWADYLEVDVTPITIEGKDLLIVCRYGHD